MEKDINLQIAKKVQMFLEKNGVQVVMTRDNDEIDESKRKDMERRVSLINEVNPFITISIHQNSYSDSSVKGAQVFYYSDSIEGKEAASFMQEILKSIDSENSRDIKGNNTFYLLKKTKTPIVIVECGFLSNPTEATKLVDESYQEEMANAIGKGVLGWIEQQ